MNTILDGLGYNQTTEDDKGTKLIEDDKGTKLILLQP
jgi:hypothetical protein